MTEIDEVPIEYRYAGAKVDAVDFAQRLITVIAAPYDEAAEVQYRQEIWHEYFMRGAFDAVASSPHRIRVNRDHNKGRTVGKAVQLWPQRQEGLVTELRIAKTELGDETLALADEDCLSASVGFGVKPNGQELDRRTMTRRITKAYLDHIALVEAPAYTGAQVLDVRNPAPAVLAASLEPIRTPLLDDYMTSAESILRWTTERLNKQ